MTALFVFACSFHVDAQSFQCGTDEYGSLGTVARAHAINGKTHHTQSANTVRVVRLAVETDTRFFEENGGTVASAVAYARMLVQEASRLYERELGVRFEITSMKTWTTANPDPYSCDGNGVTLGERARKVWEADVTTVRDAVLTLTSGGGGGIGYQFTADDGGGVSSLCTASALAAASPFAGTPLPSTEFNYSVYIIAHELGHVFGAVHSHNCYWAPALDTCTIRNDPNYASGDACLAAPNTPKPNPGSIMSYCGGINNASGLGFTIRMTFLERISTYLAQQLDAGTCVLAPSHPIIMLLSPHGGSATPGSTLTVDWRSDGVSNVEVEWKATNDNTWTTIASRPAQHRDSLLWTVPPGVCAYDALVRVRSTTDAMIADTSVLPIHVGTAPGQCLQAALAFDKSEVISTCKTPEAGYGGVASADRFGVEQGAWAMSNNAPFVLVDAVGPSTEGTLMLWFSTSRTDGVQHLMGSNWQEASTASLFVWEGTIGSAVWSTASSSPVQAWGAAVKPQTWYQVALTFDGASQHLYVNGALASTVALPAPVAANLVSLYVGKRGADAEPLYGSVDDVRVYGCALSADSIKALYEAERVDPTNVAEGNDHALILIQASADIINVVLPPTARIISVTVHDLLGNTRIVSDQSTLSTSQLNTGMYLISVKTTVGDTWQRISVVR